MYPQGEVEARERLPRLRCTLCMRVCVCVCVLGGGGGLRQHLGYSNAHTKTKHFKRSQRSKFRTLSLAQSKIRAQKIDEDRKPLQ